MRTRIKICGLTRPDDVTLAAKLGADALGFVLAPGKRTIPAQLAKALTAMVPPWVNKVMVIGPEQKAQAAAIAESCRFDTIQLHGGVDAAFHAYYRGKFTMIQALSVDEGGAEALQRQIDEVVPYVDGILLDTSMPGHLGGTGEAFDWAVIKELHVPKPLMVAGGLNAENVRRLIATADIWGVDVSSGVEAAPGMKDGRKLAAFFDAVAGAGR